MSPTSPCAKYRGKQRRACYATDGWKKPVTHGRKRTKTATKRKK